MSYDKLRDFVIRYADRILFGTDIGGVEPEDVSGIAQRYNKCFVLLETDETLEGGFFDDVETKGLKLPREALEMIYYKNAMRIYPRVKEVLGSLGYEVAEQQ
jgi:hypothetical protein